jgi:hypothetical protein
LCDSPLIIEPWVCPKTFDKGGNEWLWQTL